MYQDFIPFLKVNDIPLYNTSPLFTREPVDGHLGCFLILAVVNNAAINMSVKMSHQVLSFLLDVNLCGIGGSCGDSIYNFLSNFRTVFHSTCAILHSYQHCSTFSTSSLQHLFQRVLFVSLPF